MAGAPIRELNSGLVTFKDELVADALAAKRVEVGILTFGPPQIITEFQTADQFSPPNLTAGGDTPMGAAISMGLDALRARKDTIRANGVSLFRPWVFLITDGAPTDNWHAAAAKVAEGEHGKAFQFFAVGVEGANMETLAKISPRPPLKLEGLRFRDLFQWLSASMQKVSHSQQGASIQVDPPTWSSIQT
jgi:uncharacterized protein YegL